MLDLTLSGRPLVEQARELCDQGLHLQAQALLPQLAQDLTPDAQLARARILVHLGDRRRAEAIIWRVWRRQKTHAGALVDLLRAIGQRKGPYRAWQWLQRWPLPEQAVPDDQAEYLSIQGYTMALLRDFEQAQMLHQQALALSPGNPWLLVEQAFSLELADQYQAAIDLVDQALLIRPGYRPALQQKADLLVLVGREPEALALLASAAEQQQSGSLSAVWHDLLMEVGDLPKARQALDLCVQHWPLADKGTQGWLAARHADLALLEMDLAGAQAQARLANGPYYDRLAERLSQVAGPQRRVVLPVGFVRQHYNTCAPATLSALCQYWGLPADHLGIAEEICYDGTPYHSERRWAESQGLWVREFTLTWDVARALLDVGVPFSLTTVSTLSGHLQAVIGYDEWRGSLLIRDPFKRTANEFDAQLFFETQAPNGPRAMLLLPQHEAARLDQIALPDTVLWDGYHQLMSALHVHDRALAVAAATAMVKLDEGHRLTLAAQRSLAMYDRNDASLLDLTERMLAQHPDEPNLVIHKASLLRTLGSRSQGQAWWDQVMARPGFDPILSVRHVQFLMEDGRTGPEVRRLLDRVLAMAPTDGAAWYAMGGVHWQAGEHAQAMVCYRLASCLQDSNEYYAETYVGVARVVRGQEAGLQHLAQRARRLGPLASHAWITWFNQLEVLERTAEGFDILDEALQARPDDPDLRLFVAEAMLRHGRRDEGQRHLDRALPTAKRATWLRTHVGFLREEGQWAAAIEAAREAASLEPLNIDAHRLVANGLWQAQGRDDALAYLRSVAAQHPHHFELQRLLLSFLPEEDTDLQVVQLDHMLSINPVDAWTHREKAFKLARGRRLDEAWHHAQEALTLSPGATQTHASLGYVQWRRGHLDEARRHFQDALTITVDNDYAVAALVDLETTREGRLTALQFIRQALIDQVTTGEGLLAFQEQARGVMAPEELLQWFRDARQWREDLWQTWAALAMQLTRMGRFDDSLQVLDDAIVRYPLLARLRTEKAQTLLLMQRRDAARETLVQALQLSPGWPWAVRLYVDSIGDEGRDFERALPVLESALRRQPTHADLRALRGWVNWKLGQIESALADLQSAVALDPSLRWAWDTLQHVGRAQGQPTAAADAAEEVAKRRPGDITAWLRLSEFAASPERALEAAEHGVALEPRHQAMAESHLNLLLRTGRLDQVDVVLQANPWGEHTPLGVRAFKARLQRQQGQFEQAVSTMRALLDQDPDHAGLWRELADWFDERGQVDDYVHAARQMVRLAPQVALSHGYLGHALRQARQWPEAEQALAQALAIDPSYRFAAIHLIELALARSDWALAGDQLDALERHDTSPLVALRRLEWAVGTRQRQLGVSKALAVVCAPQVHPDLARDAVQLIQRAQWDVYFAEAVEQALRQGPCSRPAVRLWLEHQGGGWLPGAFYRDVHKALKQDPSHAVKHGLLIWLGDKQERHLLDRFVKEFRPILQQDMESWGLVGYALLTQDRYSDAVRWMAGWRERPDIPSWVLDNLAFCLRQLSRPLEAAEVTERSLSVESHNPDAWLWQAVDAAHRQDDGQLSALLDKLESATLRPYFVRLRQALQAYRRAVGAQDSALALRDFAQLKVSAKGDPVLRKMLRRYIKRLVAGHTPGWKKPLRWFQFQVGWS